MVQDMPILTMATNRKSYTGMIYQAMLFSVILNHPNPGFRVTALFNVEYLGNGMRYRHTYKC